ncbi:head decoration protein [Desulfurobacterium thermolithotrophum]|uniref:head decoration protein n=1 Tax=Desulfurobacterium thermolithotrophum TaxID=64160 RepID=UPI0013D5E993|nr:head decoration protein [Desulfurobacterium thermolithotrophum]
MPVDGKIGTVSIKEEQIIADSPHKPVIVTKELKSGQGTLPAGSIIARDMTTGKLVLYDPAAKDGDGNPTQEIVGVLTTIVDTDRQTLAPLIVHGVVIAKFLKVAEGSTVDEVVLSNLEKKTIWAV